MDEQMNTQTPMNEALQAAPQQPSMGQMPPMQEQPPVVTAEDDAKKGKTVGILGVVFGAIGILIGFIPIIGIPVALPFAIAGLVLGIIAMVKSRRTLSWFGLALPILALIVMFIIAPALAMRAVTRTIEANIDDPEFQAAMVELEEAFDDADIDIKFEASFDGFDEAAATYDGVAPEDLAGAVHSQQAQTAAETQAAIEAARAEAMANQ